ncbi:cell division ATP-binding protein FtsE [Thermosulfuriphilus ammonigenes]|uniref:Cell division ATP-binding protein FtsE n=1 Tax=Thermosulfuriphilus ammonigenes TaxID=1936021 RepID=A0A6G7PZP1_9BACT|nr:cell division ATP-binding protein FtsE [Thermosulfuriphilus ammonigenes]
MVRFEEVTKLYPPDITALDRVSFSVERGEFVFITGPSGAGKTTLLNLILRSELPSQGEVYVEGRPLSRLKPRHVPGLRRRIGIIFQDFKLLVDRTALENVALALEVQGLSLREGRHRALATLEAVGLKGKENKYPPQLSGGERQRVAIARAIVNRPALLLADEPTGNLDPRLAEEIIELFEELNARGTSIILATHNQSLFIERHRRVLVLDSGRLIN